MSVPYLSFILFGQYFLAYKWGLFPVFFSPDLIIPQYVVLPVLIGIITGLGGNVRFYRTVMLDEMRSDYVRTAFAKGLTTRRVLFKHVLKNAMIPIITQVVLAIPFLFLGSLLLERFFGIPGLGRISFNAIFADDYPVVITITLIGSLVALVIGMLLQPVRPWTLDKTVQRYVAVLLDNSASMFICTSSSSGFHRNQFIRGR